MALATVDAAGAPRVRSVVCRKVDDDGSLLFASDTRSEKHDQLVRDPRAEAVCWLPTIREQFRFAGAVELIGGDFLEGSRIEIWRSMPPQSRAVFSWPSPGTPKDWPDERFAQSVDVPEPPKNFEILSLIPHAVERLELSRHPHRRTRWRSATGWLPEELNP